MSDFSDIDPEQNEPEDKPPSATIDWTNDSVRLLTNGERIKCMIIMDVTMLSEDDRKTFMERSLAALTRMGQKVVSRRKDRN